MVSRIPLRALSLLALASALWFAAPNAQAGAPQGQKPPGTEAAKKGDPAWGERWIESRLIAPCCWGGTLDTHESEIVTQLRGEIRTRLDKGEKPEVIEEDLISRYGERMRAMPKGADPMVSVALGAGALVLFGGFGLVFSVARRARKQAGTRTVGNRSLRPAAFATAEGGDAMDARIDEELRNLDG